MQPHKIRARKIQAQIPHDLQVIVSRASKTQQQIEQALVLPPHLQLQEGTLGDLRNCGIVCCKPAC